MKSEFALAFNQICAEYGLPRDIVLDALRTALVTAYRRDWKVPQHQSVTAEVNLNTGLAHIFLEKVVVASEEELAAVEFPETAIVLQEARKINPQVNVGDVVRLDVTPQNFGRIAAQTAKQVITQKLREAERESQFHRFSRQENEIIIGTVQSVRPRGVILHLERTEEALMPKREQLPGERYHVHQKIRVYVLEVKRTPRGPEIIVSRAHPLMLRRLLELEVPEIASGQVEIKAIAREAGSRAKVAVVSHQPGLDPVGACVGMRGVRIQNVSRELHGERIDIVLWDPEPAQFIANALSMKVFSVTPDEYNPQGRTASVVVMDDQLSLAIGRLGQNARLTAKLTGYRVDIQGITEAALHTLQQLNANPELLDDLKDIVPLIPRLANIMHTHEEEHYPYNDEELRIIKTVIEAVKKAVIARRDRERPETALMRKRRSAQQQAQVERQAATEEARRRVPPEAYERKLDTLDLAEKVRRHLIRNGLQSVGEVMERMALGDESLLMLNGVGAKALREIKAAVENSGLQFVDPDAEPEEVQAEEPEEAMVEPKAVVEPEPEEKEGRVAPEVIPEPQAQPAEESKDEFSFQLEEIVEEVIDEVLIEEEEEIPPVTPAKKKKRKKKSRTLVYDEETGEVIAVRHRRRRSTDIWDNFEDDF